MTLNPPGDSILLHVCCAPCSGAIIEKLCADGFKPTIFWSNSNIYTAEEHEKRLSTLLPYAESFGVPVVVDEYNHEEWLEFIKGRLPEPPEDYPERSWRCRECFRFRLLRAARYATAHGFDCLTTSLASSRWKSLNQVDEAGLWAIMEANLEAGSEDPLEGLQWWPQNWRRGGLQPRKCAIIKERGFYNQTFCGCEYSL